VLKPGFGHCIVAIAPFPTEDSTVIALSWRPAGLLVEPVLDLPNLRAAVPGRYIALDIEQSTAPLPLAAMSCVAICKAVLGCRKRRVRTPWQLWRWALRQGGREL